MSHHESSWVIMSHHGSSWVIMGHHGSSWVITSHHKSHNSHTRVIMNHHKSSKSLQPYDQLYVAWKFENLKMNITSHTRVIISHQRVSSQQPTIWPNRCCFEIWKFENEHVEYKDEIWTFNSKLWNLNIPTLYAVFSQLCYSDNFLASSSVLYAPKPPYKDWCIIGVVLNRSHTLSKYWNIWTFKYLNI